MPANVYMRRIVGDGMSWIPLAAERLVMDATIVVPATNGGSVGLRFAGGPSALWPKGTTVSLRNVDLSKLECNGGLSDAVLVVATSTP